MAGATIAAIDIAFDPWVRLGDAMVRWQAIGVALAVLVALLLAAALARAEPPPGRHASRLRSGDLLYLSLAAVPGAVVGGRLVHALAYWDGYAADPAALLDPSRGGLSLLGAVLGGTMSALYVASLLEGTARRWADTAALPMLVALAMGKLAQFAAGGGQGAAWDGRWAVAFTGPGPWLSPDPAVPAHPVAVYEALWAIAGIVVVSFAWVARSSAGSGSRGGGAVFLAALCWFLAGRAVLGTFWRDDRVVGGLNVEQALALAALVVICVGTGLAAWGARRRAAAAAAAALPVPGRG